MLGRPTVNAEIATIGQHGEIVGRLWDVSPEGTMLLVDRGVYALTDGQSGRITFQLHGNGYHFAKGHRIWLQLLGRDAPYYQAGNTPFSVKVKNLRVTLPTLKPKPR
jgi:predicted acyl esterase